MRKTLCIVVMVLIAICLASTDSEAGPRRGRTSRSQHHYQPAAPAPAPAKAEEKAPEVKAEDKASEENAEEKAPEENASGEQKHVAQKIVVAETPKEPETQLSKEEMAAVNGLNAFRARCGLPPCQLDLGLCKAAQRHSQNMARYGFFSHVTPWGETHGHRGARAENIYMGSSNGMAANNAWINSSGHRANMLGPYTRVGVGCFGGFFTQMFR
ncbi:MAG: CAP domain-containing protein [Planctomycetia bacterium]|nr:CAP domain-containing protein [Planctomycetia bacterium]